MLDTLPLTPREETLAHTIGSFTTLDYVGPDDALDIIVGVFRDHQIWETDDVPPPNTGLYSYVKLIQKTRTYNRAHLRRLLSRQFGHDLCESTYLFTSGLANILAQNQEIGLVMLTDDAVRNMPPDEDNDPYYLKILEPLVQKMATYISRGILESTLWEFLSNSERKELLKGSITLTDAMNLIHDFLLMRRISEENIIDSVIERSQELGISQHAIDMLREIMHNRHLSIPENDTQTRIPATLFIVLFNIIKNAYTLLSRQISSKSICSENGEKQCSVLLDEKEIGKVHSQLWGELKVHVEFIAHEKEQYIIVSDSCIRGFDLNAVKARMKHSNVLTLDPAYNEVLAQFRNGDFSVDRDVRAKLDEFIFAEGFSTNGSTGIGLGLTEFLAGNGMANIFAYETPDTGVIFVCHLNPTKKRTHSTRAQVGQAVASLLRRTA